jgi:hypothetical protein
LQLEEDEHWSWHKHKLRRECTVNPLRLRVSSPPNIAFRSFSVTSLKTSLKAF